MTLTLKGLSKNGKRASYAGAAKVIYVDVVNFEGGVAPQTWEVQGIAPKPEAKPKLTPEERKALRAARPKPTLAEQIAKREARLERDKARLAAAEQPSL